MLQPAYMKDFGVVRSSMLPDHYINPQQEQPSVTVGLPIVAPLVAQLAMKFEEDLGTTRLVERENYGPLLIQKPFYPEGREVCQVVIVHPPGGVVGGDQLELSAQVGNAAHAQITTPGAAKWYKANGHISRQKIRIDVGCQGSLEWVPQETIFFNNADVVMDHQVTLAKEASYVGCDILCFGRTASGESFSGGQIKLHYRIRYEDKLIWHEQFRLLGGGAAMKSPLGLAGNTVCATLIAVGKVLPPALIMRVRDETDVIIDGVGALGVTQLKSIVVARYLGNSSETARRVMLNVWGLLRPALLNRPAMVPRMWNT